MRRLCAFPALAAFFPALCFSQVMNVFTQSGGRQPFQVSEIDSITFGSEAGTLKYLGHASVKLAFNGGIVVYIDPYAGTDYSEPADIILVTHGHGDHNQVGKVAKKADCAIYSGKGASVGGTRMSAGDSVEVKGVKIKAVEAYNANHARGTGVGFVVEFNGVKLVHCGDTSKIPEMAELESLHLDYALLPIDGVYNMGPADAMQAVELIKPKRAIPIHAGPSSATQEQRQANIDKFTPSNRLVLKDGETIYL
jgi:L-ascorbate metabolism protein UlaG (beta-lactamase superfamily)